MALRDGAQLLRHSGTRYSYSGLRGVGDVCCATQGATVRSHCSRSGNCPHPSSTQLCLFLPKFALKVTSRKSIQCTQTADSFAVCEIGWVVRRVGLVQSPKSNTVWKGVFNPENMASGRETQHRETGGCLFSSLPGATKPSMSLQASHLLQAMLPLPEHRVSELKQDFVYWLFKKVPGFLEDSNLS